MMCLLGQLYSIPEPVKQGLVVTECFCRTVQIGNVKEDSTMGIKVQQSVRNVSYWLNKHHVLLVCFLSAIHIGLSCIHTRDSGTTDLE